MVVYSALCICVVGKFGLFTKPLTVMKTSVNWDYSLVSSNFGYRKNALTPQSAPQSAYRRI